MRSRTVRIGMAGALLVTWPADAGDLGVASHHGFRVRELHDVGAQVFLLGVGEIDGAHAGPELIAVDADGTILMLLSGEPDWDVVPLPVTTEPMMVMNDRPAINIADVHGGFAGNEIVVETGNTVRVFVQSAPGVWESQIVLDGEKFFGIAWGVRAGDIDPARPGDELFYMTETAGDVSAGFFARETAGEWSSDWVFAAEVGMDSAIGDSNLAVPGNEIVVATEMGPVYEITPQPGSPAPWPTRTLWDDFDNAGWTLRIADVLPGLPGNEIVYATRYNDRVLLSYEQGAGHAVEVLFTGQAEEPLTMWDMDVGNIIPASPTLEIVAVDDLGLAYLVQHDGTAWSGQVIWQDPAGALNAVAIADYLPALPGEEIVCAGASGRIVLITRDARQWQDTITPRRPPRRDRWNAPIGQPVPNR